MQYTDFLSLAQNRYSVRKFSSEPVAQEHIEHILQAGMVAPTAKNLQPQKIFVIQSAEALAKLPECTDCHFNAPLAMLICCDHNISWRRDCDGANSGEIDIAIVNTHMMLAAAELGVGSTWVMWFNPEAVKEKFNLAENLEPVAFLMLGYPAENAHPSRLHTQSRSMDEIVSYL